MEVDTLEQHEAAYGCDWDEKKKTEKLIMNLPSGTTCTDRNQVDGKRRSRKKFLEHREKNQPPRPGFLQYVTRDREKKTNKQWTDVTQKRIRMVQPFDMNL